MMTPEAVDQFNDLFAGHVGVFVDAEGVTTFRTWNTEIKLKDGNVIGKAQCSGSNVTVPAWLRDCETPGHLTPWSNEEVRLVDDAIRQHRSKVMVEKPRAT